jgi:hypothetical protein
MYELKESRVGRGTDKLKKTKQNKWLSVILFKPFSNIMPLSSRIAHETKISNTIIATNASSSKNRYKPIELDSNRNMHAFFWSRNQEFKEFQVKHEI